jgi:predicted RecA/RadA family phage recombinase
MAEAYFVHENGHMPYTPGSAVDAGDVVVVGAVVGVATQAIPANTLGSLATQGVFKMLKPSSGAIAQGVKVYWDTTGITSTAGSLKCVGYMSRAAADGDTEGYVELARA